MTVTLDTTSLYSGKGFDVQSLVNQILDSERGQETQWKSQQTTLQSQIAAVNQLETQISALYTDANNLRDFTGVFGSKTASSSQPGIVIAAATSAAETANHIVQVQSLASTGAAYSNSIASDATLDAGSLSITVGSNTQTIDIGTENKSLADVATAINDLNMGVTAKIQTDSSGSRLTLVSNSPGAAAGLQVSGGTDQLAFTNVPGTDALVNIDGVPYQSTSNIISGAITGITLNLASAAPNTGVTLSVSPDVSSVAQALSTFVTDYNAVVSSINAQFTYASGSSSAGVLSGDSAVRMVQESLLSMMSFSMSGNGSINTLQSLGISMGDDGTLSIDSSSLNTALTSNFTDLSNFFLGSGGFGETLGTAMTALNSPSTGALALDLQSMNQTNEDLTNEINDFEARLATRQQSLLDQYSQVNAELQSLPSLQSQISDALDSLGSGSSSSSKS
jgi:flagellar hook-associated protein 2